jgi:hypothetical protein
MGDATPDERAAIHTVERRIVFQRLPASGALSGPFVIKPTEVPVVYKVTSATDPNGTSGSFDGTVKLSGLIPGTPMKLAIFGSTFDLVIKGDLQTDSKKVSWYRERLYMLGYITTDELELPDLDIPSPDADGSDKAFVEFRKKLSQELLEALFAFQVDHNLPTDENILGDSDPMKSTRTLLDANAGT